MHPNFGLIVLLAGKMPALNASIDGPIWDAPKRGKTLSTAIDFPTALTDYG